MMRIVSRRLVLALLLTGACLGASLAEASAPGKESNDKDGKKGGPKSSITVSEVEVKAKLTGGATQAAATGYAESGTVTVTNNTTKTTTTNSSLTVSVKGLTLTDGTIVTFNLNGTAIGTGTVALGRASIRLSTKKGDKISTVNASDPLSVQDPDGNTVLTGTFGAATSETEDSGK